jgi:hypothetical protein
MVLRICDIQRVIGINGDALRGIELTRLTTEASHDPHGVTVSIEGLNAMIASISHVEKLIRTPGQAFWTRQVSRLPPLLSESLEEMTIPREDLNAMIIGISHIQAACIVDYDAAGLPKLTNFTPLLANGDNGLVGAGCRSSLEGIADQESNGDEDAKNTYDPSTTGTSHGLIHHHE